MERKQLLNKIEKLAEDYCEGCFLFKHHKNENGRRAAHRFCITRCTVGEQMKEIGEKLTKSI